MKTTLSFIRLVVMWSLYACMGEVSVQGSSLLDGVDLSDPGTLLVIPDTDKVPHKQRHSGKVRSRIPDSLDIPSLLLPKEVRPAKRGKKSKGSKKKKTGCCYNGGICVLGSFCSCPRNYQGRYCQFKVRKRSCGPVKHGDMFRQDCEMCFCADGVLTCMPRMFDDCGTEKVSQEELEPEVYNLRKKQALNHLPPELKEYLDDTSSRSSAETCYSYYQVYHLLVLPLLTLVLSKFW